MRYNYETRLLYICHNLNYSSEEILCSSVSRSEVSRSEGEAVKVFIFGGLIFFLSYSIVYRETTLYQPVDPRFSGAILD